MWMSIRERVAASLQPVDWAAAGRAQCISAWWAVREDYFSHASHWRRWAPLCCTKPRRKSRRWDREAHTQRERESNTHTHWGTRGKRKKVSVLPGGFFFQSTDVGTLLRAGSGAEFVRQQHALSPLCDWDLCQEWRPASEVGRGVGPLVQIRAGFCGGVCVYLNCLFVSPHWMLSQDMLFPVELVSLLPAVSAGRSWTSCLLVFFL